MLWRWSFKAGRGEFTVRCGPWASGAGRGRGGDGRRALLWRKVGSHCFVLSSPNGERIMASDTFWLSALTGGLAGAFLTLVGQSVKAWWNRPILSATFREGEPGCEVETPASLENRATGAIIAKGQQRYLRLRIENRGSSFAKHVSVCVTRISYTAAGAGAASFAEEVFDLKLALTPDRAVFNLAAGGHRFIDLVHTSVYTPIQGGPMLPPECLPQTGCQARRDFDFLTSPARLEDLGFARGRYSAEIFVSAANAASFRNEFEFSWDGSLNGLRILVLTQSRHTP
jgi:hypothetical protein